MCRKKIYNNYRSYHSNRVCWYEREHTNMIYCKNNNDKNGTCLNGVKYNIII